LCLLSGDWSVMVILMNLPVFTSPYYCIVLFASKATDFVKVMLTLHLRRAKVAPMQTSLRSLILFVGILLLATSARLFQIQTQSLWFDEGWSAYAPNQPTLIDAANADATNPPLYYVLLNISARFLGDSEFSLRLFSLFCGLLVIALSYRFAKYLFGGRAG